MRSPGALRAPRTANRVSPYRSPTSVLGWSRSVRLVDLYCPGPDAASFAGLARADEPELPRSPPAAPPEAARPPSPMPASGVSGGLRRWPPPSGMRRWPPSSPARSAEPACEMSPTPSSAPGRSLAVCPKSRVVSSYGPSGPAPVRLERVSREPFSLLLRSATAYLAAMVARPRSLTARGEVRWAQRPCRSLTASNRRGSILSSSEMEWSVWQQIDDAPELDSRSLAAVLDVRFWRCRPDFLYWSYPKKSRKPDAAEA